MTATRVDYDRMQELHDRGWSAAQIAAELGCAARTVTRWRREQGLTQPLAERQGTPAPAELLEAAERLLDDGASFAEVERTLNMNRRTLRHHFPGRGWTKREGGRLGYLVTQANRQMNRKAAA